MFELGWIYALLLAPLCVSIACFATIKLKNPKICTALHLTGLVLLFIFSMKVIAGVLSQGTLIALNNWIYIDALSAIFIGLIGIVGVLAGVYSVGYINTELARGHLDERGNHLYHGFLHLFFFTMLLSVTTNNVILMWVGIEATTLSSAFLVGIYAHRTALEAAWKYIIICSVGVAFGLYGTILTFSDANTLLSDPSQAIFWSAINQQAQGLNPTLMHLAFVFILIGFGTKCGLFPMHTWLPDAHSEAPSPVSAILSAVLLNCAMLVVLRYYILVSKAVGPDYPQTLLLVFGLLSTGIASFFIIMQHDIKRKLAYHSIENMGLIGFAFGLGGPIGMFAGLLHTITHSLAKALLFCASGNILLKYHSRDIQNVRGMWVASPITAVLFAGGALALGGVPPFGMFASEFAIVVAGIYSGNVGLAVLCLIFLTIALAGLTTMLLKTVLGKPTEGVEIGESDKSSLVVLAIYLLLLLAMGVYIGEPILQLLKTSVGIILGQENLSFGEMLVLPWQSLGQ
ncbi:hydrogenase 4 subunit F [Caviibacterium pharyngocola]|uniref:Hydrogenase n=1 Tax=Caviibacterium pharyngocola TaxID=28159 RepID=A0A2M8RW25_9PAST|nr:hydrogenase 4 subunit F [Caviibacterium pharyngocola]PJG83080.1 hydrogenase [Caviibacterium pharyngocola]